MKEELRGTDVEIEYMDGEIMEGIVSGHNFKIGISIVDPDNTDHEFFCINGPESKHYLNDKSKFKRGGLDGLYRDAYKKAFNLATKHIKDGFMPAIEILELLVSAEVIEELVKNSANGNLKCGYK